MLNNIPTSEADYDLVFFSDFHIDYLYEAERSVCNHKHRHNRSSFGPDAGSESFYCPVCQFGFDHT